MARCSSIETESFRARKLTSCVGNMSGSALGADLGRLSDRFGLPDLGAEPILLGRRGAIGALDRLLFKQFGHIPPVPDLARLRPRLIHAHFGRGGALALPLARALKLPLVVTFHGGDATKTKHYRKAAIPTVFQRRCAALQREAALIICVADHIREALIAHNFPPAKLKVIHYGIEPEAEKTNPGPRSVPICCLSAALSKRKGFGICSTPCGFWKRRRRCRLGLDRRWPHGRGTEASGERGLRAPDFSAGCRTRRCDA